MSKPLRWRPLFAAPSEWRRGGVPGPRGRYVLPWNARERGGGGRPLDGGGWGLNMCSCWSPFKIAAKIVSRRAGTPSGPVPDISPRARRAPPPHQDFFVPHDEPNTAGPRRHCGDSRAGGRHLFPIRFGNFWCKEKIGPKRGSGPSGLSRRAGPKFRIRVGHSAADRAGHAPPLSRHWAGRGAGRGSNCCRKMGLIVSH